MSDLADFLLARIADDEREVQLFAQGHSIELRLPFLGRKVDPRVATDRLVAECEAKRLIVQDIVRNGYITSGGSSMETDGLAPRVLVALALPYSAHQDYRDEWRP